jgi:alkanesulfonate monooxygenase SsuD/methylene tetrahydromethanopterin reductase-like flavin-dependent oxidoreductase (luciferase family)
MKFGVYVSPFSDFADPRVLADVAREAEDAGWEGFFIYDHVARPGVIPVADPWIALSAIAARTQSMRIGALVTPLARRRPWKVARETVSLDLLSGGRLIVGVGGGHRAEEFDAFGEETSQTARAAMLDEALEVLTALWSGEPVHHNGTYFHVDGATFLPMPVQQPRVPIWVGGHWPHEGPLRRAARWDGVFPLGPEQGVFLTPAEVREIVAVIKQHRGDLSGFDVVQLGSSSAGEGSGELIRAYDEAGATWWLEDIRPSRFAPSGSGFPGEAMRRRVREGPPRA